MVADTCLKKKLLKEIKQIDFVLKDLNLFLDTHPCHREALEMYNKYEKKSRQLTYEYEKSFGPLTPSAGNNGETWDWIKGPWPWENC